MLSSLRLPPNNLLGKQETKKIKTILQKVIQNNQSFDFQSPVDWETLKLRDYTFIIKNPMDLGTVGAKLRDDRYRYVEEVLDDIQLVWDNCKTYNSPGTWIHTAAENLQRFFKKMVKNYLPNIPITIPGRQAGSGRTEEKKPGNQTLFEEQDNQNEVTYHQKMKFGEALRHLSSQQLGLIVDAIIKKAPTAFKEKDNDFADLLVDNLDPKVFAEVTLMAANFNDEYEDKLSKKVKM